MFLSWRDVQAEGPDKFYWDYMDATVIAAREHNLGMAPAIVYAPLWAVAPENRSDEGAYAFPPSHVSYFGRFVSEVVERYKPGGILARERGWADGYGITSYEIGH